MPAWSDKESAKNWALLEQQLEGISGNIKSYQRLMFSQITLWKAEGNHSRTHAFTCFPFPLDSVSSLTPVSSHQNHLAESCSPLLLLYSSAQHQEWISRGDQGRSWSSFAPPIAKSAHDFVKEPQTKKAHVSSSCQPNSKWKIHMINSQSPPNLFNLVLWVQSGNL